MEQLTSATYPLEITQSRYKTSNPKSMTDLNQFKVKEEIRQANAKEHITPLKVDSAQHKETIARKLIFLRKQKNKSQTQVAKKIGIGRPRYASYEEGRAVVPFSVIEKLCELYEITLDDFKKLKIPANLISQS